MFISVPDRIGFRLKVSLSDPDPFEIRNTDCDVADLMRRVVITGRLS
jgi:hypothetical protein